MHMQVILSQYYDVHNYMFEWHFPGSKICVCESAEFTFPLGNSGYAPGVTAKKLTVQLNFNLTGMSTTFTSFPLMYRYLRDILATLLISHSVLLASTQE